MMKIEYLSPGRFRRGPFFDLWLLWRHFSMIGLLIIVGCASEHSTEGDGKSAPETPVPVVSKLRAQSVAAAERQLSEAGI